MYFFKIHIVLAIVFVFHTSNVDSAKGDLDHGASDKSSFWFGPRLGKRSLRFPNDDNRQTFLRLLEAADTLKYYYNQLEYDPETELRKDPETRVTKKVIFTPKLGRDLEDTYSDRDYDSVQFTPRLGRRLIKNLAVTQPEQDFYKNDPDQMDRGRKLFSPRLGRTVNFSPRLGREIPYDVYPENIRLARSINETKTK